MDEEPNFSYVLLNDKHAFLTSIAANCSPMAGMQRQGTINWAYWTYTNVVSGSSRTGNKGSDLISVGKKTPNRLARKGRVSLLPESIHCVVLLLT